MAVSSQGMQNHFRAKSANWLANYRTCQPRFQFHQVEPWNEVVMNQVRKTWSTNAIKALTDTLDQLMARKVAVEYSHRGHYLTWKANFCGIRTKSP